MKDIRSSAVFGKRKEPHTVIIARGDDIRHFVVRPWLAALAGSVLAAFAVGYLMATSYLVLRDDLFGAAVARQARLQQAYEDRISSLRAQVDRITSRQLLDQQLMESKVTELLDRQEELSQRDGRLKPLLDRAGAAEPASPSAAPAERPDVRADAANAFAPVRAASSAASLLSRLSSGAAEPEAEMSAADRADRLFVTINRSLKEIETQQIARIRALTQGAFQTADAIRDGLKSAGLTIDAKYGEGGIGGPLLPASGLGEFDAHVEELDEALTVLDTVRTAAVSLPIANPSPGSAVSSSFGIRKDPLIGAPAFHSGIDFRATTGKPVRSTGAGVVVKAGWNGGYGRMVEIEHGNGLSTRYAHMSAISVAVGARVEKGAVLGKVGSSGRSTGPHLHYEIRRDGEAVNPLGYLKAGRTISKFL